ncbi:hypothetical protein [Photorhabdus hindustanensis]|uniref:Uncharacterized protein n=1 Tax=Photorhabdus hindustanensis TaxID=2918802 RepID=A0A2S8PV74_9GAMM|nr:hypothetical protein [Photorhabdus hindustanensis]PQQ22787.1 hypothetical protein C6H66_22130 [Photorhabdus hindustanensis]
MSAHVHAELMMQYAKDALKTDEPWKLWQVCFNGKWVSFTTSNPTWLIDLEYRRKPEIITVGKVRFPKPIDYELENGDKYYIVFNPYMMKWCNRDEDYLRLKEGRIHLTLEAAKQHAGALAKISRGEF